MFQGGRAGEEATRDSLALFESAMEMKPTRAEAQAALYNAGCCHVKLRQWQPAVDAVTAAVNDWGVKLKVAQEVGGTTRASGAARYVPTATRWHSAAGDGGAAPVTLRHAGEPAMRPQPDTSWESVFRRAVQLIASWEVVAGSARWIFLTRSCLGREGWGAATALHLRAAHRTGTWRR